MYSPEGTRGHVERDPAVSVTTPTAPAPRSVWAARTPDTLTIHSHYQHHVHVAPLT